MSGLFRPVGPLPASAYWLRRVLLAALALVLAWVLIGWLLPDSDPGKQASSGGTSNAAATSEPTADPEPNQQVTDEQPAEDPAEDPAEAPTKEPAEEQAENPEPKRKSKPDPRDLGDLPACPDSELVGKVAPEKDPAKAGKPLPLKLTFTSDAAESCKIPVSPDTVGLSVVSGSDPIWNTEDCDSVIPTGPLSMRPGKPRTITVTWPGQRSAEDCPDDTDAALPGYYLVELSLNGTVLDEGRFRLF